MTQHPDFLTESYQHYAAECRRMAAMARPLGHRAPSMARPRRPWAEQAAWFAARFHRQQSDLGLAIKQPAYT
jgi:hypothetical protein